MTISSSAANASATALGVVFPRPLLVEPGLRLLFRDDGEDLDLRFSNVMEHPDAVDAQSVLRLP
jgi:hypothetical protein